MCYLPFSFHFISFHFVSYLFFAWIIGSSSNINYKASSTYASKLLHYVGSIFNAISFVFESILVSNGSDFVARTELPGRYTLHFIFLHLKNLGTIPNQPAKKKSFCFGNLSCTIYSTANTNIYLNTPNFEVQLVSVLKCASLLLFLFFFFFPSSSNIA